MRTLLMPGLLMNISRNLARRNQNPAFFEMGSVFIPGEGKLPSEILKLGAAVSGRSDISWKVPSYELDFYYLKGLVEDLFRQIGVKNGRFEAAAAPGFHPGRTAIIKCDEDEVGIIGEVHPQVLANFDIKDRVVLTELEVEKLYRHAVPKAMTESIGRFPAVERDIAVLLPVNTAASDAIDTIRIAGEPLLRQVVIFDLFTGGQLPKDVKSIAFRLTFRSDEGTLTDSQVKEAIDNIVKELQQKLGAKLR